MCRPRPSNTLKWTLLLFIFNVQYGCCQNTTGDAPVDSPKDEAVDNDVAVLVLGAVGGVCCFHFYFFHFDNHCKNEKRILGNTRKAPLALCQF